MDEVEICNLALGWLGEGRITSLDDEGDPAELCKTNYPFSRDACIEDGDWTFCSRIVRATPLENPPNDPRPPYRGSIFPIRPDALVVYRVDDGTDQWRVPWERMENRIFVHSSTLVGETQAVIYYRCAIRITDVTKYSPNFQQALAARLSADIAMPITESKTREALAEKRYEEKMARARSGDGRQGTSQRVRSDRLRRVRGGAGGLSGARGN